jgi:hypothetical protein
MIEIKKKYHTVGTVPRYDRDMVERQNHNT